MKRFSGLMLAALFSIANPNMALSHDENEPAFSRQESDRMPMSPASLIEFSLAAKVAADEVQVLAPNDSAEEACDCDEPAVTSTESLETEATPTLNSEVALDAPKKSEGASGSTVPEKKITISAKAVCAGKVSGSASARGYGSGSPPTITVTSSTGESVSGPSPLPFSFSAAKGTMTVTAKASGYKSDSTAVKVIELKTRDHNFNELYGTVIQPAQDFAKKIDFLNLKVVPRITGFKGKGTLADCCKNGKKVKEGKTDATVKVGFNFDAGAAALSRTVALESPKGFEQIQFSTTAALNLPLNIRDGKGSMGGTYVTKSCGGKKCLTMSGTAGGTVGGALSGTTTLSLKVVNYELIDLKQGIHAVTVGSSANSRGTYDQCGKGLKGTVFLAPGSARSVAQKFEIPEFLRPITKKSSFTVGGKKVTLWGKQKARF